MQNDAREREGKRKRKMKYNFREVQIILAAIKTRSSSLVIACSTTDQNGTEKGVESREINKHKMHIKV